MNWTWLMATLLIIDTYSISKFWSGLKVILLKVVRLFLFNVLKQKICIRLGSFLSLIKLLTKFQVHWVHWMLLHQYIEYCYYQFDFKEQNKVIKRWTNSWKTKWSGNDSKLTYRFLSQVNPEKRLFPITVSLLWLRSL